VDQLAAQVEANLKRATRLRQGILKRAFEGRLVPQDPADEPAAQLLERIQAEADSNRGHGEPTAARPRGKQRTRPGTRRKEPSP
jgi:type I restriction enzyme S subunit